jgi:integrase
MLRWIGQGKQPIDRLFGARANRQTVLRHVRRICEAAGVPTVSPHGLRGTHASLAMTAGATGDLVASALGHESFTTTERHYARPEAVAADRPAHNPLNLCGREDLNFHTLAGTRT